VDKQVAENIKKLLEFSEADSSAFKTLVATEEPAETPVKPDEDDDELIESDDEDEGEDEEEVEGDGEEEGKDEDEEGEGEGDDDDDETVSESEDESESEDDDEYSEKDLRKLTSFPKELRSGIAKLPKKDQSKLVAWVNQMNEDKRKVHADATSVQTEAKEVFGRATELQKKLNEDWKTVADTLGKAMKGGALDKLSDADKKVLTDMTEVQKDAVNQNFTSDLQAYTNHRVNDVVGEVRDFLARMGKKPDVWTTRNEDDFHILLLATMFAPKEKRATILRKLRPIVENAGKAVANQKARPRPANKSTHNSGDMYAKANEILRVTQGK